MYFNWTGNEKLSGQLDEMDKKKGKPGQKIFGDHSFIQRRAKFVEKYTTCEFLDF